MRVLFSYMKQGLKTSYCDSLDYVEGEHCFSVPYTRLVTAVIDDRIW